VEGRPGPGSSAWPPPGELLRRGKLANPDAFAAATSSLVQGGPAHGCRALDLRVAGGVDLRVLPDRGLDVGAAWFGGLPLAWISAVGERGPLEHPVGARWLEAFGGGLVTTCGLRNAGQPTFEEGLHGRASHLRASGVRVDRRLEGDELVLEVAGTLDEVSALGPHLRLERRLRTRTGQGLVELEDVTTNLGRAPVAAPILYHVNLGPPLLDAHTEVEVASGARRPAAARGAEPLERWARPGEPAAGVGELVLEHELPDGPEGSARVVNRPLGLALTLTWDRSGLPHLGQWLHLAPGVYALALEPTNCPLSERQGGEERGPLLGAGASRTSRLRIAVAPVAP